MRPTHVTDILLSNWQSCVAKLARPPNAASGLMSRPPIDFAHPRIAAAAAAVYAAEQAMVGKVVDLVGAVEHQAKAALDLAAALVNDDADLDVRTETCTRFGTDDPFWAECVTEFVEHYALTRHGAVPYAKWHRLTDFVLPPDALPPRCRIAVISDWGTGEARAQRLLDAVAKQAPDVVVHLGDIYYACTSAEANAFYENVMRAFGASPPRVFTLCGNHDMYSGAAPYYALLGRLGQPASFFCLRNAHWQILAADTGYNDFKPWQRGAGATWLRDRDAGETYSELDWHKDKLDDASGRRTMVFTHHPLFTRNSSISRMAVNAVLHRQFAAYLPEIALWMWGHEHNLLVYEPFAGLAKGRCVGASAVPVAAVEDLTRPSPDLDGQDVPDLVEANGRPIALEPEAYGNLYRLSYALIDLDGAAGRASYWQFDASTDAASLAHEEMI